MTLVALLLMALVGVTLGLLGGGGSILTLPVLVYLLGMEEKVAIATSLIVVGLTSAFALVAHARRGNVRWRVGLVFAAAGSVGAFLGGLVAAYIPGAWLVRGFLVMMVATGFAMIRGRRNEPATGAPAELPVLKVLAEGLVVGVVTGLVGAGGGFLVVPALALLGGLPMTQAVGTSLLVIAIKSGFGFVGHATHVQVDYALALSLAAAAVVGSVAGGLLAARVPAALLRRAFGTFVLVMAAVMGWQQLS